MFLFQGALCSCVAWLCMFVLHGALCIVVAELCMFVLQGGDENRQT